MQLTSQQRNALASSGKGVGLPIPAFQLTAYTPFLAALEARTMGTFGTPADGFDATLAPLVAALPAHDTQVSAMSKTLLATAFTPGAIGKTIFAPISAQMATVFATGDQQLGVINGGLGNPTTTPPGGGSGGSSGGKGGGGGYGPSPPGGHCNPDYTVVAPCAEAQTFLGKLSTRVKFAPPVRRK